MKANVPMPRYFQNRQQAGVLLARRLADYAGRGDVIVLGLPRGGMPVAFEIAQALRAPLDVLVARKLGVPGHEEFALGAIAGGVRVFNEHAFRGLGIGNEVLSEVLAREEVELHRREAAYRGQRPPPEIAGHIVILVDDGIATGATLRAAARVLRAQYPAELILAAPVAPDTVHREFAGEADELVVLRTPEDFHGVGEWYVEFPK